MCSMWLNFVVTLDSGGIFHIDKDILPVIQGFIFAYNKENTYWFLLSLKTEWWTEVLQIFFCKYKSISFNFTFIRQLCPLPITKYECYISVKKGNTVRGTHRTTKQVPQPGADHLITL